MTKTICTLLLTGVALLPLNAYAQTMGTQTTIATNSAQNLSQAELDAIKSGALTNNGQSIPVDTKIMMSTGNLDGYTIRKVQQSLSERGYYKGQATGNWDNETSVALQSFQRASGDQVDKTGKLISSGTLSRLGVTMDKLTAGDGAVPGNPRTVASATNNTRISANANESYNPYNSSTVKTLGTIQTAANNETPAGTYVSNSKISAPGQTVAAPDNGSKSTMTRDAIASGRFNKTVDGSAARGTTDGTASQNGATANNSIAGTRPTTPVNSNNTANSPAVGTGRLTAGSTSSANIQTTGSLQDSAAPQVSGGSRYGNNSTLEGDNSTALGNAGIAPASGGTSASGSSAASGSTSASGGSLSNSNSLSATGSSSGIANSGGSLSDGSSAGSARGDLAGGASTSSAGSGSLSGSGGASGGGGAGGGGL